MGHRTWLGLVLTAVNPQLNRLQSHQPPSPRLSLRLNHQPLSHQLPLALRGGDNVVELAGMARQLARVHGPVQD